MMSVSTCGGKEGGREKRKGGEGKRVNLCIQVSIPSHKAFIGSTGIDHSFSNCSFPVQASSESPPTKNIVG